MKKIIILAGAAAALLLWESSQSGGGTAGDQASNFVTDGIEGITGMFSAWPSGSEPYQDTIAQQAQYNGIPTEILAWLLWKESRYNPAIIDGTKKSPVGALGIAQFMPATAIQELGSVNAALNPAIAIPGAARYLAKLYSQTGSWSEALAAYNWGIGNVLKKGLDAAPAETTDYYTTILSKANSGGETYA